MGTARQIGEIALPRVEGTAGIAIAGRGKSGLDCQKKEIRKQRGADDTAQKTAEPVEWCIVVRMLLKKALCLIKKDKSCSTRANPIDNHRGDDGVV